ncbi:tetratricopeptide (TPR) repeat protein [Amycolatopsis lexingtonensis]|uniref:Tetratricopeptide (TPR) repeat protein n=1 Tax=Amycolatopsis lexingtonensis TaxID=218822 RepID=A0ABR9HVW6_9PSEU|nr:LA2681 family HEPN domain-containing protein [Amycolatopsis lexingtonensis]MBE1495073.1 tetratricopeptide (TPR) repeat protein [Amycolatopsis lexingtonensis]
MTPTDHEILFLADSALAAAYEHVDDQPSEAASVAKEIFSRLQRITPGPIQQQVLVNCSSLLIDAGSRASDKEALDIAAELTAELISSPHLAHEEVARAKYNRANCLTSIVEYEFAITITESTDEAKLDDETIRAKELVHRLNSRTLLTEARRLYYAAGTDETIDADQRGRSFCNLANQLDFSGRWAEAYDAYLSALTIDPTNGNAAGNAAMLLRIAMQAGTVDVGHAAVLHNRFLRIAHDHLDRVAELAGPDTADFWRGLELFDVEDHWHPGNPDDHLQSWLIKHRLILATTALEGLGSTEVKWDSVHIDTVYTPIIQDGPPEIFAMINSIKAEYLVARRTIYTACQMAEESEGRQHHSDTGWYADTEDNRLYGQMPGMFVLGQRATLDVLDKICVCINEHFQIGDRPSSVAFRSFLAKKDTLGFRAEILNKLDISPTLVALRELVDDVNPNGLYPDAYNLRNAGTHRIVVATSDETKDLGVDSISLIGIDNLEKVAIQALQVTRAAIMYLVALVNHTERLKGVKDRVIKLPVVGQK